jgi:hypothetical protein
MGGLEDTQFVWAFISFTDPISMPFLAADFDRDGDVDGDDFLDWQASFGVDAGGDADADGDTDGDDFLIWQSEFGTLAGNGSAAVPEPSTWLLAAALLAGLLARRRLSVE